MNLEFYVLKDDDGLYISIKTINNLVYPTVIVEVEYTTLVTEKIIHRSKPTFDKEKELKILQIIYVIKRWCQNEKVVQTTLSNTE